MPQLNEPIVITGAGLVCALGGDVEEAWGRVRLGETGIGELRAIEDDGGITRHGGEYPGAEASLEPREIRLLERAIDEAQAQAQRAGELRASPDRRAVVIGTTLSGMRRASKYFRDEPAGVMRTFLAGPIAGAVARKFRAHGPCLSVSAACASGLSSIGHAVGLLRSGAADAVVAGGYDPIAEYVYGGFRSLRLVSENRVRPFASDRAGMNLGEAYSLVIVERAADAAARGAAPLAYISGFGESSDGYHLTKPHPEGEGLARAIVAALAGEGLMPGDIDLISLHGTGTPANDAAEFQSMSRVFGGALPGRHAVAYKAALGHTLGGAGAAELILTLCAMRDSELPPTSGLRVEDLEFPIPIVEGTAAPAPIRRTLGVSLGFGGSNAAIVISSEEPRARGSRAVGDQPVSQPAPAPGDPEIVITGTGSYLDGREIEDWWLATDDGPGEDVRGVDTERLDARAAGRRSRRLSTFAKLVLASGQEAAHDRGGDWEAVASACSGMVGTAHGASEYSVSYYEQLVSSGLDGANPWWFAEGVPNVGSAHLSMELGIKATAQSVIGTRTSGLDALVLSWMRVRVGEWPSAVVVGADEQCDLCSAIYAQEGLHRSAGRRGKAARGFISRSASAAVMIESSRGAPTPGGARVAITHASMGRAEPDPRSLARGIDDLLGRLGDPSHVISSGNGTWLGVGEMHGVRRAQRRSGARIIAVPAFANREECYGASGIAAVVGWVKTGRFPGQFSEQLPGRATGGGDGSASELVDDVAILCSDYDGAVAGVRLKRL